jgi:hypothetical protein
MSLTGLLVAGALALGWNMGARTKSPGSNRTPTGVSSGSRGAVEEDGEGTRLSEEDRQELARLVRREVMAAQRPVAAAPQPAGVLPAQEPDPARREEIFTAAYSTVQNAREVGTWTQEDGMMMQEVGASLTPEQRRKIGHNLMQAINARKVRVEEGAFVP